LKHDLETLKAVLLKAPAVSLEARLTRRVEYGAFARYNPPDWLYTAGKPKRYNPAGVHCVYFGAQVTVTRMEFDEMWRGSKVKANPHWSSARM
jgi:hypothetical protein